MTTKPKIVQWNELRARADVLAFARWNLKTKRTIAFEYQFNCGQACQANNKCTRESKQNSEIKTSAACHRK